MEIISDAARVEPGARLLDPVAIADAVHGDHSSIWHRVSPIRKENFSDMMFVIFDIMSGSDYPKL
ncbi:hypothetical protein GCM10023232_16970 [Sphingosinicella ginsenosidimutans]